MIAGHTPGVFADSGNRGNRQRGRVGHQHAIGCHDRFKLAEKLLLDIKPLDDRLDHEVAGGKGSNILGKLDAGHRGLGGLLCDLALGDERLPR